MIFESDIFTWIVMSYRDEAYEGNHRIRSRFWESVASLIGMDTFYKSRIS